MRAWRDDRPSGLLQSGTTTLADDELFENDDSTGLEPPTWVWRCSKDSDMAHCAESRREPTDEVPEVELRFTAPSTREDDLDIDFWGFDAEFWEDTVRWDLVSFVLF